jgi:hypothetical protein
VMPYRWDDDMVISVLAEAQDTFCEETGFFVDFSTFTQVLTPNVSKYALDSRIIKVLEVWNLTSGAVRLSPFIQSDRPISDTSLTAANPYAWQADQETGYLTVYPVPVSAITLTLRAQRYTLYSLDHQSAGVYDKDPEISSRCHRGLIHYAAALWYGWRDRDEENNPEAAKHMGQFKFYVNRGRKMFDALRAQSPALTGNALYLFQ